MNRYSPPRVLTIAGSDSGGGAGIQADLKTFQELGVYGMSAITAITAQNSLGVQAIFPLDAEAVKAQLDAVLSDIGTQAVKTGMLHNAAIVRAVAEAIERYRTPNVVVDPVLAASDGSVLLQPDAIRELTERLFPSAVMITPNIPEACLLLGRSQNSIVSIGDMTKAAIELLDYGSRHVLVKGGHLSSPGADGMSVDVLVSRVGSEPYLLQSPRIATAHTHGTGCTAASAAAAWLALGLPVREAAANAKRFVSAAIGGSFPLGSGKGTLLHSAHRNSRPL
ncbi:bifunctional hydroxymethylpyrimidine kinase/phosphomethylpyrimidine kinase [Paenibacillus tarimensis]